MLKTIFQLLLAAIVIWALTLPFIDADELVSDEQTSSNDIKKEKKKVCQNIFLNSTFMCFFLYESSDRSCKNVL